MNWNLRKNQQDDDDQSGNKIITVVISSRFKYSSSKQQLINFGEKIVIFKKQTMQIPGGLRFKII
jgi:hypothetical protein